MFIIYIDLGRGWTPITYMVKLAAALFEAELQVVDYTKPGLTQQLESVLLRRDRNASDSCLVIAPSATYLPAPLHLKRWRTRFGCIAGWAIDSFWEKHIPKFLRYSHLYDYFFVTTHKDVALWNKRVNAPVHLLPWGSDVLRLGGGGSERPFDLLRVGRQPPEWDNDERTLSDATARGMCFHGRPPFVDNAMEEQKSLMGLYQQSKYFLAFSNATHPTPYTHPTREYFTARWMDALACGAVVAGIPPKESGESDLFWDGALLDLGTIKRETGLNIIQEAVQAWSPAQARENHLQALKRLDWRLRFLKIAEMMKISPPLLTQEVAELGHRIATLECPGGSPKS